MIVVMSVALLASNQVPLEGIAGVLRREGLDVLALSTDGRLGRDTLPDPVGKIVLILPQQGVIDTGEQTAAVRDAIGERLRLIVCTSQLAKADREVLLDCGASEVITPQQWATGHVAERVLAQLILEGDVIPQASGRLRGATKAMRALYAHIRTVAPLHEPILILGETGTGKELVAREIHDLSGRAGEYLPVNCPEISPELLSSELFGHEKGAFTGADRARVGLIAAAGKGTVFLDEIGDLDLQSQAKLLRVLEDHKVRRVGSNHLDEVHARIVLATNRNLQDACAEGKFRLDLFERIRGFTLELPPLRERKADLLLLSQHFVEEYNKEYKTGLALPIGGLDALFRYDWPGNVRELRAVIRKAAAYADSAGNISPLILQESVRGREMTVPPNAVPFDPAVDSWRDLVSRAQAMYFRAVLLQTGGNKEEAIKLSGLSRSQFFGKLRKSSKDSTPEKEVQ